MKEKAHIIQVFTYRASKRPFYFQTSKHSQVSKSHVTQSLRKKIHSRSRAAGNVWDLFENFHLTEKVRSAGDQYFSHLCDRVGYNTLTSTDIEFLKSRDKPCLMEEDPENFKQGKVCYLLNIFNNLTYLRLPT